MTIFIKSLLYIFIIGTLLSCSLNKSIIVSNPVQRNLELYIYHNGNDTIIRDTNLLYEHLHFFNKHGIKASESWLPAKGSSKYTYFQFVNRDSVYVAYSFFLDSTITQKHSFQKRISQDGYKIIGQDSFYHVIEPIANKSEGYMEYDFRFQNDSLEVEMELPGVNSFKDHFVAYPFEEN